MFRKQFNLETNGTWAEMANNILLLRENGVTLEFSTMNGSTMVKQADVVLDTYPLGYTNNYTTANSLNDLDYVSIIFTLETLRAVLMNTVCQQTITRWPWYDLGYFCNCCWRGIALRLLRVHICTVFL